MPYIKLGNFPSQLEDQVTFGEILNGTALAKTFIIAGGTQGSLRSENYNGVVGWALFGDGSMFLGGTVTTTGDIYSGNWDGTLPLNLSAFDSGATAGYALDASLGAAQLMGDLFLGGNLEMDSDGTIATGASGESRIVLTNESAGRAWVRMWDVDNDISGGIISADRKITVWPPHDTGDAYPEIKMFALGTGTAGYGTLSLLTVDAGDELRWGYLGSPYNQSAVRIFSKLFLEAGTAAAPTLLIGADLNTGLYLDSADHLGVSTNGTKRAIWDSAGNYEISGGDLKFATEDKGLVSADDSLVLAVNDDGIAVENAITTFPTWTSSTPTQITSFGSSATWTDIPSTLTLWTHGGTNQASYVEVEFRFEWGETGAVAYTGECRIGVSFDGGSTWSYGTGSIAYVGTGTGGCGYRNSGSVYWAGENAGATGDIQVKAQWKVSNTGMDRIHNMGLKARAIQIF